jgi:hypothetical protein
MQPRRTLALRGVLSALLLALPFTAHAQFIPYFGKNKVKYDNFAWRVYRSPHFEVYYYPEFEQHLSRLVSYAESGYQKISSDLKHEINFPIPLVLYKTHSEFEETNLFPDFVPEGVLAFTEPVRDRMVVPIDEPPDLLQGLITHELTHVFEFDLIPRNFIQRAIPLWVDEGLADYERGLWDPLDLMTIRDAAVTEQVPKISRFEDYGGFNPRVVYNLGHSAFEFIEARFGKEGIRQFLYTLRKNIVGGGVEDIYMQAFRMKPDEFDEAFDKWLKERFKPFRDRQRPSDYGRDLSPDPEKSSFTQVIAFAPSPSGEVMAALSGNRTDGELDVVLLSGHDRVVIKNLTPGYSGAFEDIAVNFNAREIGRSLSFDPAGDTVAFFARTGKRRSLFLVSVISGKIVKKVSIDLDEAEAPCLLPDGKHALFSALKEGVSDIYEIDLDTGQYKNLTNDAFADADPQISPDGSLVVYTRRVSGYNKIYTFPLADPSKKTQLTFGTFEDSTPSFSSDGNVIYYASNGDDDIYNLRSLDLRTGIVRQYTDALGGAMAPAVLHTKTNDRVAFIDYFKGEYRLQSIDIADPVKEVDQEIRTGDEEPLDFQPEVQHQVIAENKRKKRLFEKLYLEGRPPINIGVTSSGDFFGGTQVALTDVLGDQNFVFSFISVSQLRSYEGTYINLSKRLHYGITGYDITRFFYATPYGTVQTSYDLVSRSNAFATQRESGLSLIAQYPLDKFRRLDFNAGVYKLSEQYDDPAAQAYYQQQASINGIPFYLNNGTIVPFSVGLVQETTRFREFGPLSGSTFSLGFEWAPSIGNSLSRTTVDADLRKYLRVGSTSVVLAGRFRGFYSTGDSPGIYYFGGNMELRGYPYLSLAGNQGFFTNAELRIPLIDVMKTPIGILGPVRGTVFFGMGAAHFKGENYTFGTSDPGISYVKDPVFGEPVSGFHLVDGRASYGVGLQFFFLGYPLHFDWSKLTDLKVVSADTHFDFWIGFDF